MLSSTGWFYWALLSAVFAALTAIFAKIGIQGVDSDLATLVRTAIIIVVPVSYTHLDVYKRQEQAQRPSQADFGHGGRDSDYGSGADHCLLYTSRCV